MLVFILLPVFIVGKFNDISKCYVCRQTVLNKQKITIRYVLQLDLMKNDAMLF